MSNYTSENTYILAIHEKYGGNKRMLLLHICENGRREYIIGSYFMAESRGVGKGFNYSWDWGHYFDDVVSAVDYWKKEVLFNEVEEYVIHDWGDGELEGSTLHVTFNNAQWNARMYNKFGMITTYAISEFATQSELFEAFRKHRPNCQLERIGYIGKEN